jgi:hypothetical protein
MRDGNTRAFVVGEAALTGRRVGTESMRHLGKRQGSVVAGSPPRQVPAAIVATK